MKEQVSILDYLSSSNDMSSMMISNLSLLSHDSGDVAEKPCIIFKEYSEKIKELCGKSDVEVEVNYTFFFYKRAWMLVTAVRIGKEEINTYLNTFNLNYKENVDILKDLNKEKSLNIVFYNQEMCVEQVLTLRNNPFYSSLNAMINEIEYDVEYDEERHLNYKELKRDVLKSYKNDARIFFEDIKKQTK